MLRQKLMFIAVAIAGSCLLGCSAVPKARITGIDSFTVAQTLYENGTHRTEFKDGAFLDSIMDDLFDQAFGKFIKVPKTDPNALVSHITVWPKPEVLHNRRKTTVKYTLQGFMFDSTHCRATIRLDVQRPSDTVLSVKCEKRDVNGFIATVFDYYLGFLNPFYKRDHGREQMIMTGTTQQLITEQQAKVEWLGKWRPDPNSP